MNLENWEKNDSLLKSIDISIPSWAKRSDNVTKATKANIQVVDDKRVYDNSENESNVLKEVRDKTADFRVRQNSRFWKRDKIADFDNETKPPIWKWDKTADLM